MTTPQEDADGPDVSHATTRGRARPARGRRRGSRDGAPTVPRAEFTSYYGRPILKEPTWRALDIAGYLFLGGLAGASSALAAGAHATGRTVLARTGKVGAVVAGAGSLAGLIHDLGRPARFLNMLRVFKHTSPMSVGSWLLAGYLPVAGVAAASALTGNLPRTGALATLGAGLLGPGVATYTAVLISDTAIPAWHEGHREMPIVFAGSAATAAGGLGLLAAPRHEAGPARAMGILGVATETVALEVMKHRLGSIAEPYTQDTAARYLHTATALNSVGVAGALLGRRNRMVSAVAGAAFLTASATTRFGIFHAGVESARDPRYTVEPQRARHDAATHPG